MYGFDSVEARQLFLTVQTVSGVGPRLALAVLATLEPDELVRSLGTGDIKSLTRVPGIGKRTAERMVLELRDKVGPIPSSGTADADPAPTNAPAVTEVAEALEGLGFPAAQSEKTATAVLASDPDLDPAQALRLALKSLGKR